MSALEDFGWDDGWRVAWDGIADAGANVPARVIAVHRDAFVVWTAEGERTAELSGRLRHRAGDEAERPAVGDWVAVRLSPGDGASLLQEVLPRRTHLARKVPGPLTAVQVVAANVDFVVIVAGLDGDYNPRRLERALVLAWDGGAQPVIALNKSDLLGPDELAATLRATEDVAPGVSVLALSAATGEGLDGFERGLPPGRTAALIGSSGVGKSTLLNRLLGAERQRTNAVRTHDSRGRHTTTHRELLRLPSGALLIDTPGLRELQLWAAPDALDGTFRGRRGPGRGLPLRGLRARRRARLRGDGGGGGRHARPRAARELSQAPARAAAPRAAPGRARTARAEAALEGDPQGGTASPSA